MDSPDLSHHPYLCAGYQNMCRWNLFQLVQHDRIQALDYYCRLDTHSYVRSPLGYDIFDFMAAQRLKYGFVAVENEPSHVITGASACSII